MCGIVARIAQLRELSSNLSAAGSVAHCPALIAQTVGEVFVLKGVRVLPRALEIGVAYLGHTVKAGKLWLWQNIDTCRAQKHLKRTE